MKRILSVLVLAFTALVAAYAQSAPQTAVVYVSLASSLDASTVKSGDPLSVMLVDKAKFADGSIFPKGTILTGHIVSTSNGNSVVVVLDQAQVGAKSQPIRVTIRSVYDSSTYEDDASNSSDIKTTGAPISKLHGVDLAPADNASGTFTASKSKHLWLENHTLLGVAVTKA